MNIKLKQLLEYNYPTDQYLIEYKKVIKEFISSQDNYTTELHYLNITNLYTSACVMDIRNSDEDTLLTIVKDHIQSLFDTRLLNFIDIIDRKKSISYISLHPENASYNNIILYIVINNTTYFFPLKYTKEDIYTDREVFIVISNIIESILYGASIKDYISIDDFHKSFNKD